jgi:ABC-2 type transport system ATP-binding protein
MAIREGGRMDVAVRAEGLVKRFGATTALDGFDLEVGAGTVCGLLGPNGAGKTTAVRILATLLRADTGRAEVAGCDVAAAPGRVRRRIGLVGQHAAVDEVLSGRENLVMFGRLNQLGAAAARVRADELLERFGLAEAADRPASGYSGGMRRRLDLAAGLLMAPAVLFLDEPTTGLDPRARALIHEAVLGLAADGTTVVLTTQDLTEADRLAGQVLVVDHGRVIARGSPDELKARIGGDRVELVVADPADLPAAAALLEMVGEGEVSADPATGRAGVGAGDRVRGLAELVAALAGAGIAVADVALRRPTLDEVFLELTGERVAA